MKTSKKTLVFVSGMLVSAIASILVVLTCFTPNSKAENFEKRALSAETTIDELYQLSSEGNNVNLASISRNFEYGDDSKTTEVTSSVLIVSVRNDDGKLIKSKAVHKKCEEVVK